MRVKEESETASLKLNTKKINIMASGSITSWQIEGEKVEVFTEFLFLGFKITVDGDCCHEIRRLLLLGRKTMTNLNSVLKCRDFTLPTKVHIVKAMVFPVVMYGCESWMWRRQCAEELMPSNYGAGENSWVSLGNQPWMFIARPDAEVETPVFWSSDSANVPDAGKDWGQKQKNMSEDQMAGWYHWFNGHELGQTSEDGEGQRGLACCSPWACKESDKTGWLTNNKVFCPYIFKFLWPQWRKETYWHKIFSFLGWEFG